MLVASSKPTTKGYYIFTVAPVGGLPTGIGLNDIAYYDGSVWSLYQSYARANTVLVANDASGLTQVTWRKFNGTWMSTAEEYIPDGKEYQTSKLYNGKVVYRKCINGTTGSSYGTNNTTLLIPTTGKILITQGMVQRTDNLWVTCSGTDTNIQLFIGNTGYLAFWFNGSQPLHMGRPFTAWVEYTKS